MQRLVDRAAAVAAAAQLWRNTAPRTAWLGIDGFGAAGKTSLAAAIAAQVRDAAVVHVDDFSGPTVAEWDWERFGRQVAQPLRAGRTARYRVWNWDRDEAGEWRDVPPGRLVIVEGVSALRREVDVEWDLTMWVEAPRDVRLARALERDGARVMPRWLGDWMPSEEAWAARDRPRERVDYVVDGG